MEASSSRVLANWDAIKKAEKAGLATGALVALLDSVQRGQPALLEAQKLGSKAAKVGFDWPDWRGLLAKVHEETAELVEAVEGQPGELKQAEVESELGDLLFTVVNLGRHLGVDAEMALRGTNARFRERFGWMETAAGERALGDLSAEELEALWAEAKVALAARESGAGL